MSETYKWFDDNIYYSVSSGKAIFHIENNDLWEFEKLLKEESNLLNKKDKEIERLNKILKYLEKYFSEREYYEFAQLVRETKEANIEWLEQGIKDYE